MFNPAMQQLMVQQTQNMQPNQNMRMPQSFENDPLLMQLAQNIAAKRRQLLSPQFAQLQGLYQQQRGGSPFTGGFDVTGVPPPPPPPPGGEAIQYAGGHLAYQ